MLNPKPIEVVEKNEKKKLDESSDDEHKVKEQLEENDDIALYAQVDENEEKSEEED
jgi:hypothetical protein